jgi:hypothetical protein
MYKNGGFPSDRYIPLRALAAEVFRLTGVTRQPSTVRMWARHGKSNSHGRNVKLKSRLRLGTRYSTVDWLRDFIKEVSV